VQVVSDAAGDGNYKSIVGANNGPNRTEMDITKAFIQTRGSETTVNFQVKDLSGLSPQQYWDSFFAFAGKEYNFYAFTPRDDPTTPIKYRYIVGDGDPIDITGKAFAGPDGVVQIVVPETIGIKDGAKLTKLYFETSQPSGVPNDFAPDTDYIMDDANKTVASYTVAACGAAPAGSSSGASSSTQGSTTASTTDTTSGSTTTGGASTSAGTTTSGGPTPARGASSGPPRLKLTFTRFGGSAKKLSKKRVLNLRFKATGGRIRSVRAVLRFGSFRGPVYGRGKAALLAGRGTLKVKATRKLKPGVYVLAVVGVDEHGRTGFASANIRLS
jgi:hypothetical protein